jgi:hypothetical protein
LKEQYAVGINPESSDNYLQEILLLFKALSSGFDPITNQDDAKVDVRSVRKSIFYGRWSPNTTQSSFQYLESPFYTQENSAMGLSKAFTTESLMANLCPEEMPPRLVGHSRTTRELESTEHQEKLRFNHGFIDGGLYNVLGRKKDKESTLIRESPHNCPEDLEFAKCEKPLAYVLKLQGETSQLEIASNVSITADPIQEPKIDVQKPANDRMKAVQGNIAPLLSPQQKSSQLISSPPIFSQSQNYPPRTLFISSELDAGLGVDPSSTSLAESCFTYKFENGRSYHSVSPAKIMHIKIAIS